MSRLVRNWFAWTFIPICQGHCIMAFPAAFSMLRCETYFAVIIRTCFTAHLSWLVCRAQSVSKLPGSASWRRIIPRSFTLGAISVCNLPLYILLSSQPSGLISGCSNLSWSLPRMFSSENVGPLLCDSAPGDSEDVIAAKNEEI
jgi:hypothetical protein